MARYESLAPLCGGTLEEALGESMPPFENQSSHGWGRTHRALDEQGGLAGIWRVRING